MGADPQLLELLGPLETLPASAGPRLEVLLVAVTGVAAGVDQVNLVTLIQLLPYTLHHLDFKREINRRKSI